MKALKLLAVASLSLIIACGDSGSDVACGGSGSGSGPDKDEACDGCKDEAKTGCEATWDACDALPVESDTCKDNLQTSYEATCK